VFFLMSTNFERRQNTEELQSAEAIDVSAEIFGHVFFWQEFQKFVVNWHLKISLVRSVVFFPYKII